MRHPLIIGGSDKAKVERIVREASEHVEPSSAARCDGSGERASAPRDPSRGAEAATAPLRALLAKEGRLRR